MKKSISAWAFSPGRPASEIFQMARANGFSHVEVAVGESGSPLSFQVTPDSTPADCARLLEEAKSAGITLSSLACGMGWECPMTAQDASVRARGIEIYRRSLHIAAALGVDTVLCIVGGVFADFIAGFVVTPYEVAYQNGLAALKELAPVAEEAGVTLGVENVWNGFLLSPLEMRAFVDAVDSPRVGCYFDVGNVLQSGLPEQWVEILGKRIARVHFKDFQREVGTLAGFCALGEGDADYAAVMQALRHVGYNGPVTAEFFDCESDLGAISRAMDEVMEEGRNTVRGA